MKISFENIPSSTKLFCDYLYNFPQVGHFYADSPHLLHPGADSRMDPSLREAVVEGIREQNLKLDPGQQALANLELLRHPKARAVVTGQQVGLLGGPLYTLYKALTAIKLANKLTLNANHPIVPIFWMETEDHDVREASRVGLMDGDQVVEISFEPKSTSPRTPVGSIRLGSGIGDLIDEITNRASASPFKEDIVRTVRASYRPDDTYAKGFALLLTTLLSRHGLITVDPSDPRLKRLTAPIFRREMATAPQSTELVARAGQRLMAAGYHRQIRNRATNLFLIDEKERRSIVMKDEHFSIDNERFTRSELIERLERSPEQFSPNVVLRPVVQDYLLPTVAYVAGPSEIAYFAQLKDVYRHFQVPMPAIYPRASMTLVEGKIRKILDDQGLGVEDFFQEEDRLMAYALARTFPQDLEEIIEKARTTIRDALKSLGERVVSFDRTLEGFLESAGRKMDHQVEHIREKVFRAHRRRYGIVRSHLSWASHHLYPRGNLQERFFNVAPWLMRHGPDLIEVLYEKMDIEDFQHQIVYL